MRQPTIAEELLLLSYDPISGRPLADATRLTCGLAGAMITDLALEGHVAIEGDHLHIRHSSFTGDPHLDDLLGRIAAERRPRKVQWWVQKLQSARLRRDMLRSAVDTGLLQHEERRVLGLFPFHDYRPWRPWQREELHERLRAELLGGRVPEERGAALLALCRATRLDRKLFPDLPGKQRRQLMKQVTEDHRVGQAVAKVIQSIEAATAAVIAAAAASTAAGS